MKTEVFRLTGDPNRDNEMLSVCAKIIKDGGLVVFPTETVYGLGADATNESAVASIYLAKGRPSDNPLIIHISHPNDAQKYAYVNDTYFTLAEKYMPGPLTVILQSRDTVPAKTRGGLDTVAIRCPETISARELIRLSDTAIAAPSANLSGSPSPTSAQHVIDDMTGRVDAIIDGGVCDFGLESTIVKIEDDGSLTLLRPGRITVDMLSNDYRVNVADSVTHKLKEGERALSPGMKYRHYAPSAPLILLDGGVDEWCNYITSEGKGSIAIIAYDEMLPYLKSKIPNAYYYSFGGERDEAKQAHDLFEILRDADKRNFSAIFAPLPGKEGISLALYNRMIRAAAHKIIRL